MAECLPSIAAAADVLCTEPRLRAPSTTTAVDAAAADVVALASAPTAVRLCGSCIKQQLRLGTFSRVAGRECEGRAVYQQGTADTYLSFFRGRWRVSKNTDVGTDVCWMKAVADDAQHPTAIRTNWQEYNGAAWVAAPAVSVLLEGTPDHGAQRDCLATCHTTCLVLTDGVSMRSHCSGCRSG